VLSDLQVHWRFIRRRSAAFLLKKSAWRWAKIQPRIFAGRAGSTEVTGSVV